MECTVEFDELGHPIGDSIRWAKSPIRDEQVLLHLSHGQTLAGGVDDLLLASCL